MKIWGYDWDDTNLDKLLLHDLGTEDVEYLFEHGEPYVFRHPSITGRWIALGFAPDSRFILVVFEHDEQTRWVRVVTAFQPDSERYWRLYAKKKNLPQEA